MSAARPWVVLTEADVKNAITAKERRDFATAAADNDPADRLPGIIADLVAEIRGYIATWSQNTVSADETKIPPEFKAKAVSIARWRLLTSIPSYQPGKARELDFEKADLFFNKVAEGKIRPAPADDAIPNDVPLEVAEHGVQVVSAPGSRTGRARMNGL